MAPMASHSTHEGTLVPNVYAASACAIAISGLFFAARIACRRKVKGPLLLSDYVLALGLFCCWGLSITNACLTILGLGTHLEDVEKENPSLSQVSLMLKIFLLDEVLYDVGVASIKVSILLFYRSIFRGKNFMLMNWALVGIVCAWCVGNLLPSIFSCRPISGFWDLHPKTPPVCINKELFYILGSSFNIATDLAILALPIGKVMELKLSKINKVGLAATFLLGGLVCVVSIYRFTVLIRANSPDVTWQFADVLVWSQAELCAGVASACLPLMRPLLAPILRRAKFFASTKANNTAKATHGEVVVEHPPNAATATIGSRRDTLRVHPGIKASDEVSTIDSLSVHEINTDDGESLIPDHGIRVTTTFEMSTIQPSASVDSDSREDLKEGGPVAGWAGKG